MRTFLIFRAIIITSNLVANTFYIDPVNGSDSGDGSFTLPWKTLENVINSNLIESKAFVTPYDPISPQLVDKNLDAPVKPGDTLMLYSGLHGVIDITNYVNDEYITIQNVAGNTPLFEKLNIQGGKRWKFQGIDISTEPYGGYINDRLVFLESHGWQGPVSKITIQNCYIYSTQTAWTDITNWLTKASDGIDIKGDSININNNQLENIRIGIKMRGNNILVSGNTVKNFSGDGIRLVGSDCIVEKNIIKNCYDVDANHDDGIQSFTTGGLTVDNNIVRQNIILNYEDPNQPLLGNLQGIGCFDGPFHNWIVENNLIIVNHWHGISFYGLVNGQIVNNTVLDPTPSVSPGPSWIRVDDDTGYPSSNCIVKNNAVNTISITSNTTVGNNVLLPTLSNYTANFVNYSAFDFHLLETSPLVDIADNTISPIVDLDGNIRPSGVLPDVGAFEYQFPLSIADDLNNQFVKLFPNPFADYIEIKGLETRVDIKIFDNLGRLINMYNNVSLPRKVKLANLNESVYYIQIIDNQKNRQQTNILVKRN